MGITSGRGGMGDGCSRHYARRQAAHFRFLENREYARIFDARMVSDSNAFVDTQHTR